MLEARDLAALRGERLVFRNVSFRLQAGGALVITGPNGAGKSTLLRVLAGLKRPDAGAVLWDGAEALGDRVLHASRVAYLGHQDALKPALTAAENLRFWANSRSAAAALEAAGLSRVAGIPAGMLSAGQRRRVALARLILAEAAAVWLLDEPATSLDDAGVARLGEALAAHLRRGGLVVAATHSPLPLPQATGLRLG